MIQYKERADGMFELLEDYKENGVDIAKGFVWDGASIPWWLRWLVRPTKKTKEASMVHDLLYSAGSTVSQEAADLLFHKLLLEDKVSKVKAWAMWRAVDLFGGLFFKGDSDGKG